MLRYVGRILSESSISHTTTRRTRTRAFPAYFSTLRHSRNSSVGLEADHLGVVRFSFGIQPPLTPVSEEKPIGRTAMREMRTQEQTQAEAHMRPLEIRTREQTQAQTQIRTRESAQIRTREQTQTQAQIRMREPAEIRTREQTQTQAQIRTREPAQIRTREQTQTQAQIRTREQPQIRTQEQPRTQRCTQMQEQPRTQMQPQAQKRTQMQEQPRTQPQTVQAQAQIRAHTQVLMPSPTAQTQIRTRRQTQTGQAQIRTPMQTRTQARTQTPKKKKKMSKKKKRNELRFFRIKARRKMKSPNPRVRIQYKLDKAKRKETWLIEKLRKYDLPKGATETCDPEILTEEDKFYLKRTGEKKKHYVPVGRRGVFGGVVLNMHLHWKNHETVKVVCKPCRPGEIHEIAQELTRLSKGIVIEIMPGNIIIFYRGKNYVQPQVMSPPDTLSKLKALEKYKYRQSLEHTSGFIERLENELREYLEHLAKYKSRKITPEKKVV